MDEECEALLREDAFGCRFKSRPGAQSRSAVAAEQVCVCVGGGGRGGRQCVAASLTGAVRAWVSCEQHQPSPQPPPNHLPNHQLFDVEELTAACKKAKVWGLRTAPRRQG